MNNGQTINEFAQTQNYQAQLQQLYNSALYIDNAKNTNQYLINNHFKVFGEMRYLTPQLPQFRALQQPVINSVLTQQVNFDAVNQFKQLQNDQAQQLQAARKQTKSDFHSIYNEVLGDKEVDDEDDQQFKADTFADYMPAVLKIGLKHPDAVVETSSLSSVKPPDIWYNLSLPKETIKEGKLSALQLESVVYACQQHATFLPSGERAGYLIGDGAGNLFISNFKFSIKIILFDLKGIGKGRTVAGIIYENYLKDNKKAIWLSVSADLKFDAERDLKDIGAPSRIKVHALNKMKYAKINSEENGNISKGIVFSTYSSLISESSTARGKCKTRIGQLVQWCGGENFEGVIIFDECHKAKNLVANETSRGGKTKSTKTGQKVLELQQLLPKARIVYASATGATEPKNMAYMVRLGLWGVGTAFEEFNGFHSAVNKRGVGAMELVAIDMKQRGMYIARQLSFKGVEFEIKEIELSPEFIEMYDQCVDLWADARCKFEQALGLMEDDKKKKMVCWGNMKISYYYILKFYIN